MKSHWSISSHLQIIVLTCGGCPADEIKYWFYFAGIAGSIILRRQRSDFKAAAGGCAAGVNGGIFISWEWDRHRARQTLATTHMESKGSRHQARGRGMAGRRDHLWRHPRANHFDDQLKEH